MIVTTYAWLVNIYNIIANIFKVVINILFGTSNILRPILMTVMAGTLIFWITSSVLKLMKPMIGFLMTIWKLSFYIKEHFKTWIGWISGAAKGLVGVITGATSLSAVLSGIMAKATITANMLTLGIATGIFALSLYLVNVVDRTLNRKINKSLDKLEQQTKKASDTTKNAFIQPTQDTAKMKDNMSSVADSTKEIKDNLQSFDVIHAIEQQAEMVANVPEVPEDILGFEGTDYSTWLDNLIEEATKIDTSITSAAIPKLEDMSIKFGDIWETIKTDFAATWDTIKSVLGGLNDKFENFANKIFEYLGIDVEKLEPPQIRSYGFEPFAFVKNAIESASYKWTAKDYKATLTSTTAAAYSTSLASGVRIEIVENVKDTPEFITREAYINGNRVQLETLKNLLHINR